MRHPFAVRVGFACTALTVVMVGVAACSDDPDDRSESAYCTEVGNRLAALEAPNVSTGEDVDDLVSAWRSVADAAPLAIEEEWDAVIDMLETAATVDPSDPASVQLVADTSRSTQSASDRVITYTDRLCGVVIGDVAPVTTNPAQVPPTTG